VSLRDRCLQPVIKSFIPEASIGGCWGTTTFNNASDLTTGNYSLDAYKADEVSPTMGKFLVNESYGAKLADAFAFNQNYAPPGAKWIYQSLAIFVWSFDFFPKSFPRKPEATSRGHNQRAASPERRLLGARISCTLHTYEEHYLKCR
jgi:hypothetical protein